MNIKTQLIVMKMFITGVCFLFKKKSRGLYIVFIYSSSWLAGSE